MISARPTPGDRGKERARARERKRKVQESPQQKHTSNVACGSVTKERLDMLKQENATDRLSMAQSRTRRKRL